jgi:sRNA-binding carbon storage regulator CsrA
MLCVSLKAGEFIEIRYAGRVLRVWPEATRGNRARLKVDAPKDWKVLRSELVEKEAKEAEGNG